MSVTGHQYTSTRVRGLAPWAPKAATLAVVADVKEVLREYRDYLPMTARQVFYRLVGAYAFDKTEKSYSRLLEYLNRARRAGLIPWAAIRDDGFDSSGGGGWDSPAQVIRSYLYAARNYERDRQDGQPVHTEVWVEAAGMMPQVSRSLSDLSIVVYSSGGFNSTTAKHQTARRIVARYDDEDLPTRVLHVGDYDPSGVAIIDSLADDLWAFVEDMGYSRDVARFVRVAVTPDQIDALGLPGAPAKRTDQRAGFDDLTVQAEALSPPQLADIVRAAVLEGWDEDAHLELLAEEGVERQGLIDDLEAMRD